MPARDAEPFVRGLMPPETYTKQPDQVVREGRLDLDPLEPQQHWTENSSCEPLARLAEIRQGVVENPASVTPRTNRQFAGRWRVGEGVFALRPEELERLDLPEQERRLLKPYHDLCDLGRYELAPRASLWLIHATAQTWPRLDDFPMLARHLQRFRPIMEAHRETRLRRRAWWHLHWPREQWLWNRPKILALQMAPRPAFVPADAAVRVPFSVNVIVPRDGTAEHRHYLAAVLNSALAWRWLRSQAKRRGVGLEVNGHVLARVPIRRIDFSDAADAARHGRIVALVDRMLAIAAALKVASAGEREALHAERAECDCAIDLAVEQLYRAEPA